jgi:hypothetical protein
MAAGAKEIERNRRLLDRIAYGPGWRQRTAQRDVRQIQVGVADRLAKLLDCIAPGAYSEWLRVPRDRATLESWRAGRWINELPNSAEFLGLTQRGASRGRRILHVDSIHLDLLREGPLPNWVQDKIQVFRNWGHRQGHDRERVELSVRRALAPLCWARRTAGLERRWDELLLAERRLALDHSFGLEKVWLGKVPHLSRTTETS